MLRLKLLTVLIFAGVRAADFAEDLAVCTTEKVLNVCLKQTLEDLRPVMKVGLPQLNLPPMEPMNVEAVTFQQGQPPVVISATFRNVVVTGLSNFLTNYIDADPIARTFRIGLTVPAMDIQGFYDINGEVFILPLGGSGTFTMKLLDVTAIGASKILAVSDPSGKRVLQVDDTNIDFNIGKVQVHMDNLFNGENQLLADTVNKFLNDHGQEVLSEVKPEISKQLTVFVTRVMNNAFSKLSADKLLSHLESSVRPSEETAAPRFVPFSLQHNQDRRGKSGLLSFLTRGRRQTGV